MCAIAPTVICDVSVGVIIANINTPNRFFSFKTAQLVLKTGKYLILSADILTINPIAVKWLPRHARRTDLSEVSTHRVKASC